jgi:carbamate kinase
MVPSPQPLEIVEETIFHDLLDRGLIAIGAGGGGVPVFRNAQGELEGIEAVIDKDRTSALLASRIGIDTLVILTQVDHVSLNFNEPEQKPIENTTASEMETWLQENHFLEGSMKPKVEAALYFLKHGGKRSIIAHLDRLADALAGQTGTHILPG